MKLCGAIFLFVTINGLCGAYQLSKDAKGENGLVFNETTINKNGFLRERRLHKRSSSDEVDIRSADMSLYMQGRTIQYARDGIDRYSSTKDIADHIKDNLDGHGGGKYHCFVGTSFGYSVTYDLNYYFYFKLGEYYILAFRH